MSQSDRITDRVTKLRLRLMEDGRPQYQIANELGCPPSRLSEYALGNRPIPSTRIYDFCALFSCNPDELLGYADIEVLESS